MEKTKSELEKLIDLKTKEINEEAQAIYESDRLLLMRKGALEQAKRDVNELATLKKILDEKAQAAADAQESPTPTEPPKRDKAK